MPKTAVPGLHPNRCCGEANPSMPENHPFSGARAIPGPAAEPTAQPDPGIPWNCSLLLKDCWLPKEPYLNSASQKSTSVPTPLSHHLMLNQRQNRWLARKIRRWIGIPWLDVTQGSGSPHSTHWITIVGVLSFQKGSKRVVLLMEEILHHLIGILSLFYTVLYIWGGAGFLPPTVGSLWSP